MSIVDKITAKVKSIFEEQPQPEKLMVEGKVADTGISITAEAWEVGNVVTTVTEEGDEIAIPGGAYTLEDGTAITVDDDGVITEVVAAEAEEEVEAEEKKEEDMTAEKAYVTETQLAEAMAPVLEALKNVSVQLSAVKPKAPTEPEKVEAENKLLKQRLAEKRKAITDKAESKASALPLPQGRTGPRHRSGTRERLAETFKDFDFTIQKN